MAEKSAERGELFPNFFNSTIQREGSPSVLAFLESLHGRCLVSIFNGRFEPLAVSAPPEVILPIFHPAFNSVTESFSHGSFMAPILLVCIPFWVLLSVAVQFLNLPYSQKISPCS